MKVRCSPGYFLIFLVRFYICFFVLPWWGVCFRSFLLLVCLFLLFYLLLSSHFVSSVLVACLRCVFLWLVSSRPRDVVFVSMVHLVGVFAGI